MFNKKLHRTETTSHPLLRKGLGRPSTDEGGLLTRTECDAMRGIAILGIFLHNFCHWLSPVVKENEYQYFQHHVDWFNDVMSRPWNELTLFHILSFFGHYGVPVFLFLSAYGLVKKYESPSNSSVSSNNPSALSFIGYHWKKLFRMMIVGFVAFTMVDAITPGQHHYAVMDIIAQMGLFNNLLPHPDDIIWPGPYWFFGLMIQLYIVYRLLLYRRHWAWVVGLTAVCCIVQLSCPPESEALNRWRYNFIGGMLPFGAGLLYAKYMKPVHPALSAVLFLVSMAAQRFMSLNYYTWYIVPLFVCSACIGFVRFIGWSGKYNKLSQWIINRLSWMGSISAALFVCHPITRKIFIPISRSGDYWTGLLLYAIASVCLAWLFRELMKKIPSPKLK
ncbi:acyltransferase family protein [Prevotella dentasini]|uniref:acyltransferase family protein n=1 Tax=Prevotella dentasini TaxID=589537 RepID=UPI000A037B45